MQNIHLITIQHLTLLMLNKRRLETINFRTTHLESMPTNPTHRNPKDRPYIKITKPTQLAQIKGMKTHFRLVPGSKPQV